MKDIKKWEVRVLCMEFHWPVARKSFSADPRRPVDDHAKAGLQTSNEVNEELLRTAESSREVMLCIKVTIKRGFINPYLVKLRGLIHTFLFSLRMRVPSVFQLDDQFAFLVDCFAGIGGDIRASCNWNSSASRQKWECTASSLRFCGDIFNPKTHCSFYTSFAWCGTEKGCSSLFSNMFLKFERCFLAAYNTMSHASLQIFYLSFHPFCQSNLNLFESL